MFYLWSPVKRSLHMKVRRALSPPCDSRRNDINMLQPLFSPGLNELVDPRQLWSPVCRTKLRLDNNGPITGGAGGAVIFDGFTHSGNFRQKIN